MRRIILGSSAVVLSLLVSSCGGDDGTADTTTDSASPSSSTSSPATDPSTSATAEPSEPASTVAPATGPLITAPGATLNAPADWTGEVDSSSTGGAILGPDVTGDFLALSYLKYGASADDTLDDLVAQEQRTSTIDPPLTRQPDVIVAGQPAFHLAGEDKGFVRWTEVFGFGQGDNLVTVIIGSPLTTSQTDRDAMSAAVLASLKLTG